jgi:hypothetical protein
MPRHLTLKLGLQPSGSQLPEYQPPTWLRDHTLPQNSVLDLDLLIELVGIPSLSSLRCQLGRLGECCKMGKPSGASNQVHGTTHVYSAAARIEWGLSDVQRLDEQAKGQ